MHTVYLLEYSIIYTNYTVTSDIVTGLEDFEFINYVYFC